MKIAPWYPTPPAPPADDRQDFDDDVEPGHPATLDDLRAIWRDRDVQYAKATTALRDAQIESVREYRKKEVNDLDPTERAKAWGIAATWYPPKHGQGIL
jgi:hypothetical protein